jgi:hypothetical protein
MSDALGAGEALHALGFVFAAGALLIIVTIFVKDGARAIFYGIDSDSERQRGRGPPDINHMKRL